MARISIKDARFIGQCCVVVVGQDKTRHDKYEQTVVRTCVAPVMSVVCYSCPGQVERRVQSSEES